MKKSNSKRKPIPKTIREMLYFKYLGRCAYCGQPIKYEEMQIDHFAPVYLFGDNISADNLKPACRSCNLYKNTFTIEKFRNQISQIPDRLERDSSIYRIAQRYNLICRTPEDVKFYYETLNDIINRIGNLEMASWSVRDQEWWDLNFKLYGSNMVKWLWEFRNVKF